MAAKLSILRRSCRYAIFSKNNDCFLKLPGSKLQNRFFTAASIHLDKNEPKIYTKTGDKGASSLFTGERRPKNDAIFEALGTTDELTSHLGLAREYLMEADNHKIVEKLEDIQCMLQDVASNIATPKSKASDAHLRKTEFNASVEELEEWIDHYHNQLPPLRNFILPSGGKCSCCLHIARSVSRRLERSLVPLLGKDDIDSNCFRYVNRLSDFLFTVARFAANKQGKPELVYQRKLKQVKKS